MKWLIGGALVEVAVGLGLLFAGYLLVGMVQLVLALVLLIVALAEG